MSLRSSRVEGDVVGDTLIGRIPSEVRGLFRSGNGVGVAAPMTTGDSIELRPCLGRLNRGRNLKQRRRGVIRISDSRLVARFTRNNRLRVSNPWQPECLGQESCLPWRDRLAGCEGTIERLQETPTLPSAASWIGPLRGERGRAQGNGRDRPCRALQGNGRDRRRRRSRQTWADRRGRSQEGVGGDGGRWPPWSPVSGFTVDGHFSSPC